MGVQVPLLATHPERDGPAGIVALLFLGTGGPPGAATGPAGDPDPEPSDPTEEPRPPGLVRISLAFYGGLTALAWLWAWVAGRPLFGALAPSHGSQGAYGTLLEGVAAGVLFGAVVAWLSRVSARRFGWARRMHRAFAASLGRLTAGQILALALLSAIGEEAFFRGALQPTVGLWVASALFGLMHFPVERALWPWPLMAFAMGLAFGALFDHFGTLWSPIAAHFAINLLNLWQLVGPGVLRLEPGPPD